MRILTFTISIILIFSTQASGAFEQWSVTENDFIYPSLSNYLPQDAISPVAFQYDTDIWSYIAVRYSIPISVETRDLRGMITYGIERSHGVLVGMLHGDTYVHLFNLEPASDTEYIFYFEEIDFGSFISGYGETTVVYMAGNDCDINTGEEVPVLKAFRLDPDYLDYREMEWEPEVLPVEGSELKLRAGDLNRGVVIWMTYPHSRHSGPFRVTQVHYQIDPDDPGILTETRRETTEDFFTELPSDPPFVWLD